MSVPVILPNEPTDTFSFGAILHPVSTADFFGEYFESKPLIVLRGCPDYYRGLLTLDDIDRIITTLDNHYPDVCLVNADCPIDAEKYVVGSNSIDASHLYRLYAEGATIILNQLNTCHPPLANLCAALELEFSAPFQTNVYLTPPHAKGFKAHFDTHDVFVLQLHGSKCWRLYGTPITLPLDGQGNEVSQDDPGAPSKEFRLNAGDTLYIPRGFVHDATSCEETSLHATVGILSHTWADLIFEALAHVALADSAFRRSLPTHFARADFDIGPSREMFRNLVERFSKAAAIEPVLDLFIEEFLDRRRPRLRGQMAQLASLNKLTIDSAVACRPHLAYSIHEDSSMVRVRCHGKEISFPLYARSAVRHALRTPHFIVRDMPQDLDDESKVVLVRRLVREGILTIDSI